MIYSMYACQSLGMFYDLTCRGLQEKHMGYFENMYFCMSLHMSTKILKKNIITVMKSYNLLFSLSVYLSIYHSVCPCAHQSVCLYILTYYISLGA